MVGSALVRLLRARGFTQLLTPSREELDLLRQKEVEEYLQSHRPDGVVVAAARVGGIFANMTYPAQFLYENIQLTANLVHGAHLAGVERLLFLGSTCIYPKFAPQPIKEEALLTSALEPSNEPYALAKIAGVKLCASYSKQYGRKYISAMPTNLYGPGDNYHPQNAHVIPALLRRFHEAKERGDREVVIWGSGRVLREFLHVDDLARALLLLLESYEGVEHINVGSEEELSIGQLAHLIGEVVGYRGKILFDETKPEGTPRKKSDCTRIFALGWRPEISLREGLTSCYEKLIALGFSAATA